MGTNPFGKDIDEKLKMDLELPSSLMALISVLKDKGILSEEDMALFNERQKYVQDVMFETSKAVGMIMMLQEELGDAGNASQLLEELEKVVENGKVLMEMCGRAGMAAELYAALEQARAGVDVLRSQG